MWVIWEKQGESYAALKVRTEMAGQTISIDTGLLPLTKPLSDGLFPRGATPCWSTETGSWERLEAG